MSASRPPVVIEFGLPVAMRDGVVLRADLYRPAEGRSPVLVQRTPYGRTRYPGSFVTLNPVDAAMAGYATVIQDTRGRGESEGVFDPFYEFDDGYDTVEWAAAQSWSDGRVGMFGSSYMGATAAQAAVAAPPSLRASVAAQASSDYYDGRSYWGGAFEYGALLSTSLGTMALGSLERGGYDRTAIRSFRSQLRSVLNSFGTAKPTFPLSAVIDPGGGPLRALTPWFFDWVEHDTSDEYWTRRSLHGRYGSISAPILHVTSWYDAFHIGTIRNYVGARESAATAEARDGQYLLVGPWAHYALRGFSLGGSRVGDVNFGTDAALNLDAVQLGWFDHWMGDGARPIPQKSRVRLFVMGANEWRDYDDWPVPGVTERSLFLGGGGQANTPDGDGTLQWEPQSDPVVDRYTYDPNDPVPTTGGCHLVTVAIVPNGPLDQAPLRDRRDILVYATEPLADDVEVIGWISAELSVRTSAPSTDFTARLIDVDRSGRALCVCDGIRRIVLGGAGSEVSADGTVRVQINLGGTAHRFLSGHRIRLDVSSSNFPRFDPNPNTGGRSFDAPAAVVADQEVLSGGAHPSRVVLPVMPTGR